MSEPLPEHYVGNNARHHRDIGPFRIAIEGLRASDGKLWWRWDVECRSILRAAHLAGTGPGTPAPDNEPEARRQAETFLLSLVTRTAAELVRAADEVELVTERSCFTCRHNENEVCYHPPDEMEMAIDQYAIDAGCAKNNGGMPLDRSIPCPGWSAKVTT